jgi:hypothetical protein
VYIGATLTATSVGITARVLTDLRQITSAEAKIILGAAVIDDVLGLEPIRITILCYLSCHEYNQKTETNPATGSREQSNGQLSSLGRPLGSVGGCRARA